MNKIDLMFFVIGRSYSYDNEQIQTSEGIISKKIDTINFVDIRDIKTNTNIFGWGTVIIEDTNGEYAMKYVKNPKEIHATLNKIFLEHKNKMKRVDIS